MGEKADIIIRSNLIFSGLAEEELLDGFVGIKGKEICCIEKGNNYQEFLGNHTKIFDMTDKVVTPGFVDNHVFFIPYNCCVDLCRYMGKSRMSVFRWSACSSGSNKDRCI